MRFKPRVRRASSARLTLRSRYSTGPGSVKPRLQSAGPAGPARGGYLVLPRAERAAVTTLCAVVRRAYRAASAAFRLRHLRGVPRAEVADLGTALTDPAVGGFEFLVVVLHGSCSVPPLGDVLVIAPILRLSRTNRHRSEIKNHAKRKTRSPARCENLHMGLSARV